MSEPGQQAQQGQNQASRVGRSWFASPNRGRDPGAENAPSSRMRGARAEGTQWGVNEVEWATPSGLRRRLRLQSLRTRPHSGNANGFSAGRTSGGRWPVPAESSIAVVRKARFCVLHAVTKYLTSSLHDDFLPSIFVQAVNRNRQFVSVIESTSGILFIVFYYHEPILSNLTPSAFWRYVCPCHGNSLFPAGIAIKPL